METRNAAAGTRQSGVETVARVRYREFARGAETRRATRDAREESATTLYELSSVFVLEGRRGEGLGASIVKRLLEKHRVAGGSAADVYLLTLATTTAWRRAASNNASRGDTAAMTWISPPRRSSAPDSGTRVSASRSSRRTEMCRPRSSSK